MKVETKTLSAGKSAAPAESHINFQSVAIATGLRRYVVWAEIITVFALLELALWAPAHEIRNRWAAISALTILVVTVIDVLLDYQSLQRLGLGLPKLFGASVVLLSGVATSAFLITLVSRAGGQVPANPTGSQPFNRPGDTCSGRSSRNSYCNRSSSTTGKNSMAVQPRFG